MTTPHQDLTFQTGCWIFGFTLPGQGSFGPYRHHVFQAIFGTRTIGSQIPGKNIENDVLSFVFGAPVPRATGSWPRTPDMCIFVQGGWAKRVIHGIYKGRPKARRFTPYEASAKESLVPTMLRLIDGAALWQGFSPETKARLSVDAKRTRGAFQAYNYWSKLYISNDPKWTDYV